MDATALALVTTSANSLVSLMTSEVWEQVKSGVAALFRRGRRAEYIAIEEELDESARELRVSLENGDQETQEELRQQWRGKLRRLIREEPELFAELRSLLNEWSSLETTKGNATHIIHQTATARDGGRIYQQGTGTQNNY
jgi:dsDNA-specific endonuclease/ATPase MutS2